MTEHPSVVRSAEVSAQPWWAQAGESDVAAYDLVVGPGDVSGRCTLAVITLQRT